MIIDQNVKIKHDPTLIPNRGEKGCPSGLQELLNSEKCCCESQCCWNNCQLNNPPTSCLAEVDSIWVNDTTKGAWVAQVRTGRMNFDLVYHTD